MHVRLAARIAAVLLTGCMLVGAPARAQVATREEISLQNQILELRHQLEQLRAQPAGGSALGATAAVQAGPGANDLLPQLLERVSALEDQVRSLRGRVEDLENAQARTAADLGKRIDDLAFQVQQSQGGAPPAPAAAAPAAAAPPPTLSPPPAPLGTLPAGPAVTPRRTPELAMQEGQAALARRDYAAAEAAAQEVLKQGRGPHSYEAQFLLAQALSGERKWRDAAVAYGDVYQRATTGNRAQESLVGLANALVALQDKKSACAALNTLRGQFGQPKAELRESVAAARVRADCK